MNSVLGIFGSLGLESDIKEESRSSPKEVTPGPSVSYETKIACSVRSANAGRRMRHMAACQSARSRASLAPTSFLEPTSQALPHCIFVRNTW